MRIQLVLYFCLMSGVLLSQDKAYTLQEAMAYALNKSISIDNAKLNIADAEQQIFERRAIGLPKVDGKIDFQHFLEVPQVALPEAFFIDPMTGMVPEGIDRRASFQLKNNFTLGLSASMLAFDGSYFTAIKAARSYRDYVQEEMTSKQKEVRTQVIAAYMPTLLIDESLRLIDNNIQNLGALLKDTKALYQEGFVEQLDVDRLELSLANLRSERSNLARQREMAVNALKMTMNYPKDQDLEIEDSIESMIAVGDTTYDKTKFQLQQRPEYRLANVGLQLNGLNIEANKKGYWPNLAVFANYQYAYLGDTFTDGFWAPTFVVGAQVNVPIFDGFDKRSKIERAKIQKLTTQNQIKLLEESIWLEIQNTEIDFENAKNRVREQEKNMNLADRIYKTTQIKYKEGVGSSLELSQAEQALFQAQNNYNRALYEAIQAKIALDSALGK